MIVIFIDKIENFLSFLNNRLMNEIFYEIKEVKNETDLGTKVNKDIILHYLAKVGDTLVLYETKQSISTNDEKEEKVLVSLQNIINSVNTSLKLIKGKIREIFLSYSH
jgi:hypothetical protein